MPDRHQVIIPPELVSRIDDWRRQQPEIPNKSEAIRCLVEIGLAAALKPTTKPKTSS